MFDKTIRGESHSLKKVKIFFGDKQFVPPRENSHHYIHQVHGKHVIKATDKLVKADGHWIDQTGHTLYIQTADCMPVFLTNESQSMICGLHIGWRGLAQKILTQAVENIGDKSKLKMWVGPHIQSDNFCLDKKSAHELLDPHGFSPQDFQKRGTQYYIDLSEVLSREANELGISDIYFSATNTYGSVDHHSHRRFRFGGGRQWSCISF